MADILDNWQKKALDKRKENREYLKRAAHSTDRRRENLVVTPAGKKVITDVQKIVLKNRAKALDGISQKRVEAMKETLQAIIDNCEK